MSVGDFDYVSDALERIAADDPSGDSRVDWYQVAIKPAKPLCFAMVQGTPVFGLPGNPVSSFVSFELFARPALRQMMGHRQTSRPQVRATAADAMPRKIDGKLHLDRVVVDVVDGRYVAAAVRSQESNALAATAAANGARPAARRRGRRRRRRHHRHVARLTTARRRASARAASTPSQPARRAEPALA